MVHRSLVAAALLVALWPACAWEPGNPWGVLQLGVQVRATVAADRLLPDGRFKTASEYLWRYEHFEVELDAARVVVVPDTAKLSFDPAKPPTGYTLCHGGHCHATDGRLVDYATVEAGLLGGTGSGPLLLPLDVTADAALPSGIVVPAGPVDLPLGTVANVQVSWRRAVVKARVWDGSPKGDRLPKGGIAVQWPLPAGSVAAQVRAKVGPHQPLQLRLHMAVEVPASWLDNVDVAAGPADTKALESALLHAASASVTVNRGD